MHFTDATADGGRKVANTRAWNIRPVYFIPLVDKTTKFYL